MRFRSFILWVIVLAALGWAGFAVAGAGWSYFATQEMVDKVLREATGRHRAALTGGTQKGLDALVADIRNSILLAARREGMPIEERRVAVSANSAGVSATVTWSHAVITYGGNDVLALPLSVQRSFVPPP
jgi:hypothetical protein